MAIPTSTTLISARRGQAMIEYLAGVIVVSLIISSLFIIVLPDALADAYNGTFNSVHNTFFP